MCQVRKCFKQYKLKNAFVRTAQEFKQKTKLIQGCHFSSFCNFCFAFILAEILANSSYLSFFKREKARFVSPNDKACYLNSQDESTFKFVDQILQVDLFFLLNFYYGPTQICEESNL